MCLRCKKLPEGSKCPAMRALEELTPGGSEFWEDPDFCKRFLAENRSNMFRHIVRLTHQPSAENLFNTILTGVEFGYKECEKGHNLQLAMEHATKVWRGEIIKT